MSGLAAGALAPDAPERDAFAAPWSAVYVAILFIVATLPTLISPALVEGWHEQFGWAEGQLGMLAAADLVGLAVGGGSALFWQRRWPWRGVTAVALVITIVPNLLSMGITDFNLFLLVRLLAGTGAGALVGVYSAFVANARNPERFIAATTFVQIAIQGSALAFAGQLQARYGLGSVFLLCAVALLPLLPFVKLLPEGWPEQDAAGVGDNANPGAPGLFLVPGLVVLAAFIPLDFFLATYSFLPQFGQRFAALDVPGSVNLLGLSLFPSAIGPAIAFLLGERWGIGKPLVAGSLFCAATLVLLSAGPYGSSTYFIGVSALQAGWCFLNCYYYAAIIAVNNRLMVAATPVATISSALGATLMGLSIERGGLGALTAASMMCIASGLTMVLCSLAWQRKRVHPAL